MENGPRGNPKNPIQLPHFPEEEASQETEVISQGLTALVLALQKRIP